MLQVYVTDSQERLRGEMRGMEEQEEVVFSTDSKTQANVVFHPRKFCGSPAKLSRMDVVSFDGMAILFFWIVEII